MRKIFAVLAALICCLSVWTSVPAAQAFTLDKEDGEYSIQVELEGGSGKASVTSPTLITVKNGEVTADIQWSSSNYDYMIVDGKKYLPVNEEGTNSEFQIPVTIMDESMPVIADTTAMGTPHEINYTLTFYSDSIGSKSQMPQEAAKRVVAVALVIIVGGGILIKAEVHILFAAFFRFYIVAGCDDGADKFVHVIGFCKEVVAVIRTVSIVCMKG